MLNAGVGNADRRRTIRGGLPHDPPRQSLVQLILSSYREMPGLILHLPQVARLFGLPERTCAVVLDDLVREGYLRKAVDGQYLLR